MKRLVLREKGQWVKYEHRYIKYYNEYLYECPFCKDLQWMTEWERKNRAWFCKKYGADLRGEKND